MFYSKNWVKKIEFESFRSIEFIFNDILALKKTLNCNIIRILN